jgi:hypothetical protein
MNPIQNIINKFKVKHLSVITLPLFMIIIMVPKQANADLDFITQFSASFTDVTLGFAVANLTGLFKNLCINQ